MTNTFGFKDFLLLALVLVLVVMTGMSMWQEDRRFDDVKALSATVREQAAQMGQLRRSIGDSGSQDRGTDRIVSAINALAQQVASLQTLPPGSIGSNGQGGGQTGGSTNGTSGSTPVVLSGSGQHDASWARPDVEVEWQDGPPYVHDPREMEGYAEGGELIETFEGQPAKITPFTYSDVYGRRIVEDVVVESLGKYNAQTLAMEGWLAEAWQYDPAGMWLRVKIRDEACFSDGMPVTAADVKFTFDTIMNPQHDMERFRSVVNVIKQVDVVSERVCEFVFERPVFSNLDAALTMNVIPKHIYESVTPAQFNSYTGFLMGSGAYRLETLDASNQWAPPTDVVLVRNENYWGPRQAFDVLRFKIIQDYVQSLVDYENGGAHLRRATPEQFAQKSEDESFVRDNTLMAWSNMQGGYSFIVWNNGERNGRLTPFADRRVRLAMTMMIDRERINRDFYMGLARVSTGPFPPGPQTNPEIEPWPFDEQRARELLTEAGWIDRNNNGILENERGDEFRWEFTYSQGSTVTDKIGNYVVDQCRKMGIICTIRKVDWSIMDGTLDRRDFDALSMAWSASAPESDPNQLWHSDGIRNQGDNFAQWNSPAADRLITEGRGTLDAEARMKVWHRLHQVIHDEQPYTFLLALPWIRMVDKDVQNVRAYPVGLSKEEWYFPGGAGQPVPGG